MVTGGVCGAAAGAGIFMSVMTGSSPLHKDAWPFLKNLFPLFYPDWQMLVDLAAANVPAELPIEEAVHFYSQFVSVKHSVCLL